MTDYSAPGSTGLPRLFDQDPVTKNLKPHVTGAFEAMGPAIVTGSVVRPADTTAYAVGDIIANSTTAGQVQAIQLAAARVADAPTQFRRLRLAINDTAWAGATVRAHLFRAQPVPVNGDNGAFSVPMAGYVGSMDITLSRTLSDGVSGVGVPDLGGEITTSPAAGTVNCWALLETRTAVTPGSGKTFSLVAELWRG